MTKFPSVLFSLPAVDKLNLPPRAELLSKIESGELTHLDFEARVYTYGLNENYYTFPLADLPAFAASFEGQPFLRNHDTQDVASRDGTILAASLEDQTFRQTIRLTTRRGMADFVEGKIDRFSIGWFYKDVLCTICNTSLITDSCNHFPGRKYQNKVCEILFTQPRGKETSAVNAAAVHTTGIDALIEYQLACASAAGTGEIPGVSPAEIYVLQTSLKASARPKGENSMSDPETPGGHILPNGETPVPPVDPTLAAIEANQLAAIEANRLAAAELLGESRRQAALQAQLDASNGILVAQCAHLLEAGLSASHLPEVTQNRVRKTFEGKAFKAAELTAAIIEARDEVAALRSGNVVQGPGRISGMYSSGDQLTLAVEDLLGVPRDASLVGVKVARLSGIREAYLTLTGDREFTGGFFPEFSLGDTVTFPVIVKNALNKRLAAAWAKYGAAGYDWWTKIVTTEHFDNLNQIDWMILGTIGSLPVVEEKGEYNELPIGDNGETSDWTKYGGYVGLTLEAILRDDVRAFKRLPDEVAMGGMRNISEQVAYLFTQNTGAGPTLSDTGALFNSTAVTTKGGHKNLLTTALGTDLTAWRAIETAMYKQPMHIKNATGIYGTGKPQAVKPKYCLVPQDLKGAADDLFLKTWTSNGENMAHGYVEPIAVPEWTDATDHAAVADPNILPGVMLGEIFGVMPQIYLAGSEIDPAMFANDESRLKVRQFLAVGIGNWRALHKSNVAG